MKCKIKEISIPSAIDVKGLIEILSKLPEDAWVSNLYQDEYERYIEIIIEERECLK